MVSVANPGLEASGDTLHSPPEAWPPKTGNLMRLQMVLEPCSQISRWRLDSSFCDSLVPKSRHTVSTNSLANFNHSIINIIPSKCPVSYPYCPCLLCSLMPGPRGF